MNCIFRAAFSSGVRSRPRANVHCVFATASLASVFHITALSLCLFLMMQGRRQSWVGGGYLKECHFNFMLEVERAVSASGIFGRAFIPVCCEACARPRA